MGVTEVLSPAHFDSLLNTSKLVVVDFSSEMCPPCKVIEPAFNKFSNQYDAVFLHVDIDNLSGHAAVEKISKVPTFQFYKIQTKVAEFSGANEGILKHTIEANL